MNKKILFSATATEKRVALVEDGRLAELVVERPDTSRMVGNIYRGRIESILPGLQAAFVDIGIGKGAFLHASDVDPSLLLDDDDTPDFVQSKRKMAAVMPIEKVLDEGQQILVQILKEPIGTKGPKVTTQISLAGRFLVLVPDTDFIGVSKKTSDERTRRRLKQIIAQLKPKGVGFIVRTIGLDVSDTDFIAEIKALIEAWKNVQNRALEGSGPRLIHQEPGITTRVMRDLLSDAVSEVWVDSREDHDEILSYLRNMSPHLCARIHPYSEKLPLFDKFNIEKDLEQSLKRKVWLKSGGYILIDRTEALTAIDVNTGRNVGKHDVETTILHTNMDAAVEIGRQLRLRDIGGLIVVDFIDMRKSDNRRKVEDAMRKALKDNSEAVSQTPLSKFGLMEITRKRVRPQLQELYTDVCHACNGLGRVFSPATIAGRIDRWLKRADPASLPRELSLNTHPAVAAYLREDHARRIKELELSHQIALKIVEDEELDQDEFEFYAPGTDRPIGQKSVSERQ